MTAGPAEKEQLRAQVRQRLGALHASEREHASAQACSLLQEQQLWKTAQSIFFYAPLPGELNIWALLPEALQLGKTVLLPKFNPGTDSYQPYHIQNLESDLLPGKFGIHEPNGNCAPCLLKQLDLVLVPGLAFDLSGSRLGRGGGFYDKLLAGLSGTKCGVAFDEQLLGNIPVEPHDIPVDYLLTPTRWITVADANT